MNNQCSALLANDPEKIMMIMSVDLTTYANEVFPVPTANCFRTKDGQWVQLLGVDMLRHLKTTLFALGIPVRYPPLPPPSTGLGQGSKYKALSPLFSGS